MNEPNVAVLLSSYNGERFIEEQIISILSQKGVRVKLYIRDDGSTDSTVQIVSRLATKYTNIIFKAESNVGLINSFFNLLVRANEKVNYFAFADQDDIWLSDKLAVGVGALSFIKGSTPAMYCSRTEYVNSSLQHLSYSPEYQQAKIGFGNALVQNVATGCTIVINAEARVLITKELPETCVVHDWWIYLVVSAFGSVIYDPVPHIKYRQHELNVIGGSSSYIKNSIKRMRRFFSPLRETRASSQVAIFHRIFLPKLTQHQRKSIEQLMTAQCSIWNRISLIGKRFYWRQNVVDDFLLRVVILTGRF